MFTKLRDGYDPARQASLLAGQRHWLALRTEACFIEGLPATDEVIRPCLQSVYRQRIHQLQVLAEAPGDLEKILDQKAGLALYSPGPISAMAPAPAAGAAKKKIVPGSCRELLTLLAGRWHYGGDTIGESSKSYAIHTCLFALFSAQDHGHNPKNAQAPFGDLTRYSTEFECLPGGCETGHRHQRTFRRKNFQSFEMAAKDKDLKIISDRTLPINDDIEDVLFIQKDRFYIDGMNYLYQISPVGDYTNKGRDEVILFIHYFSAQGSMRGDILLIAYDDPPSGTIRPQDIEQREIAPITPVDDGAAAE